MVKSDDRLASLLGTWTGQSHIKAFSVGHYELLVYFVVHIMPDPMRGYPRSQDRLYGSSAAPAPLIGFQGGSAAAMQRLRQRPYSSGSAGARGSRFSRFSVMVASVSSRTLATETAFSSAVRTTLTGSMIPAA